MPRKSRLSDPEFAKEVAAAYLEGMTQVQMGEHFGVHKDTVRDWIPDPRVQVHISSGTRARENRIKRRIDKEIERRVNESDIEEVPLDLLLKIRKEMMGRTRGSDDEAAEGAISGDIWDALDNNPGLADQVAEAMGGGKDGT